MWIFALQGFVSVVAVRGKSTQLMVRGRARPDVAAWHHATGAKSTLIHTPRADYPYRFCVTRKRFAAALQTMILTQVEYDNFKHAVGHSDPARAGAYMGVWSEMRQFQDAIEARSISSSSSTRAPRAVR